MALKKMAGMTIVFVLRLAGGLVRRRFRAVWRFCVVQCGEMAFFVFEPVERGADTRACRKDIGYKNRQQQACQVRLVAKETMEAVHDGAHSSMAGTNGKIDERYPRGSDLAQCMS